MAFNYPAKPWTDGQEIKATILGEELVIAKYDASKNLWTHLRVNDAGVYYYVSTCDVRIDTSCSDPCLPELKWENITNLQVALDYLHYYLFNEGNGALPKIEALEKRVEVN